MEPKALKEILKEKGLDLAEDSAKLAVEAVFEFAEEYIKLSPNKTDDLLAGALLPILKPMILEAVDKIDNKKG